MRVRGVETSSVEVQDVSELFAHGHLYHVLVIVYTTSRGLLTMVHRTYVQNNKNELGRRDPGGSVVLS